MDAMDNLHTLTISDALEAIRGQKISARELVEACSRQIERLNPKLNAFITVIPPEDALKAQLPESNASSSNTLRGIPLAIKDLFDIAGIRTTIGSKFFADNIAEQDAFRCRKAKASRSHSDGENEYA